MPNNRPHHRIAPPTSRGGFTLVELLVVIGIIAILAGVALGPITRGIKQAQESAGLQTARTIALSEFSFSNDNNGAYPDTNVPTGNSGTDAATVAKALLAGGYISDPSIFYLSGGKATKFVGINAANTITANNISWDFTGNGGSGVTSNFPDQCPVIWSTVANGGTEPVLTSMAATPIFAVPAATNPFGTAGVAVAYKSNSAKFVITSNLGATTGQAVLVDSSNPGGVPTTAAVMQGGG